MMPACLGLKPQKMDPWTLVLPFIQIKFPRLGEEWTGAAFLLLLHLAAKLLNDKLQKKKKREMCNGQNVSQFLEIW